MTIKWHREEILFDTLYEADTWADSIANEIYEEFKSRTIYRPSFLQTLSDGYR